MIYIRLQRSSKDLIESCPRCLWLQVSFPSYHLAKDFATSLKHQRQLFSVSDLIVSLDAEEKARAKDTRGKEIVGLSSANVV
jgi:hypothetical protein